MDLKHLYYDICVVAIFLLCAQERLCFFEEDYDDTPSFGRCPWIRNKLKNGRVKIRSRGRIAKFLCDPGYELAGKRFATCVRGQWNNPIPVCVARGCSRVPMVANGRVTEMYRGALLVYDCNPGYSLDGVVSIYCDGRRWSTDPPACVVTTSDPETTCDFEDPELCGWNHDPTHDFDWKRNQFSTPSGHVGTGPSYDHTFGPGKGGFYLYLEASSPRKVNDTSRLFSPVYPYEFSNGCFIFWYHMYGATIGGLRVYIKLESHMFGELHASWEMYGDQGNEWHRGTIAIPHLHENFQVVIEGIRGTSYVGDTAIDDVKLTQKDCESMQNTTEPVAHTVAESCRGRCRETVEVLSCGCNEDCYTSDNCCSDYATICTTGNDTVGENPDEPIDDELGKTSSPITVSITKKAITEAETKADIVTEIIITSVKSTSTSQSTTESTTITTPLTTVTEPVTVVASTTSSQSTSSIFIPPSTVSSSTTSSLTSSMTTILTSSLETTSSSVNTEIPSTSRTSSAATTETITSTKSNTSPVYLSTIIQNTTSEKTTPNISVVTVTNAVLNESLSSALVENTTITSTPSTRRTYNLRPRTKTSTDSSTVSSTLSLDSTSENITSSKGTISVLSSDAMLSNSTPKMSTSNVSESNPVIILKTTLLYNTSLSTSSHMESTTPRSTKVSSTRRWTLITRKSTIPSTLKPSTRSFTSSTNNYHAPQTVKTTFRILKTTFSLLPSTTSVIPESAENHAPKLEKTNDNSHPTVAIISIVVLAIICIAVGLVYYLRKQKSKRQSKLSDDSEMRFLSENEIMEYSDASALDKILVK